MECPKCGSEQIGIDHTNGEIPQDARTRICLDCGHVWPDVSEETNLDDAYLACVYYGEKGEDDPTLELWDEAVSWCPEGMVEVKYAGHTFWFAR